MSVLEGLLDTSVIIGVEMHRPLDVDAIPDRQYVSVISLAELRAGVHSATDAATRARRITTVERYGRLGLLQVDFRAAEQWALLRAGLRETGGRVNVNDLWIASIALAHRLPVVTQDEDFAALSEIGGPEIIRV